MARTLPPQHACLIRLGNNFALAARAMFGGSPWGKKQILSPIITATGYWDSDLASYLRKGVGCSDRKRKRRRKIMKRRGKEGERRWRYFCTASAATGAHLHHCSHEVKQVHTRAQGPYLPTKCSQTTLRAQVRGLSMDPAKRLVFPWLVCLTGACWIIFLLTYKHHHSCIEANSLVFFWRYKTLIYVWCLGLYFNRWPGGYRGWWPAREIPSRYALFRGKILSTLVEVSANFAQQRVWPLDFLCCNF